jgi:hypothetical protein
VRLPGRSVCAPRTAIFILPQTVSAKEENVAMLPNHRFFFAETGTLIRTACLIAALVLLPETVYAVPLYYGSINGVETVNASPNPVVLGSYFQTNDVDSEGGVIGVKTNGNHAAASYGRGRGLSYADYLNVREFLYIDSGTGAQESSGFKLDDLVITGPPGNIMVSFNFVISGSIGATTVSTGPSTFYQSRAHAEASITSLQSSFMGGGMDLGKIDVDSYGGRSAYGIFDTFPVDFAGTITGTTFSILTYAGDPALSLWLGLGTSASAFAGRGAGTGSTNGHASFNFGFPTSGPVANLPEGYTLNSPNGRIVDNRFIVLAGDYNDNGIVGPEDYDLWKANFGSTTMLAADGNGDGRVNAADYTDWRNNLGATLPGGGSAGASPSHIGVPEPGAEVLFVLGMALIASGANPRQSRGLSNRIRQLCVD